MANEKKTEKIFRDWIYKDKKYKNNEIILHEQQATDTPKIDKLLKNASKGGAGKGYPEFIVEYKDTPDFLIVVECKADVKKHKSETGSKYKDFAVDGVKLYSSFLSKEYDVLSIAISGENEKEKRISHFLQLKGTDKAIDIFQDDKFLPLNEYIESYDFKEKKFNQDLQELLKYSKTLNDKLHSLKIPESNRSLLISGCLIALKDDAFQVSYKKQNPQKLTANLLNTIEINLTEIVNNKDIKDIITSYQFIKTHTILSRRENDLRDIISEVDEKINNFMKTYTYYDTLGQFYIEFLRYANNDKGLGIVLTPPHITELFSEIANVNKDSIIYDNCTGTGGFLISAMDKMIKDASGDQDKIDEIKNEQIIGVEFQHSIYALVCSNMYIHGDGRSNLIKGSCFDDNVIEKVKEFKPNVGFLNPPYKSSKDDIEELSFILNNLECLEKGSYCIAIIPMSCALANSGERLVLKEKLLKNHTLEAVFSMPTELFHNSKVGVNTCVIVFKAKEKSRDNHKTYFGYWKDDGFTKKKNTGRADYNNTWEKIKKEWLDSYNNKEEVAGHSIKRVVSAKDEWCVEAYMETDYSELNKNDFEQKLKEFMLYYFKYNLLESISNKQIIKEKKELNIKTWNFFNLEDLFDIKGSKSITKSSIKEYGEGKYPYVVTSSENNGIQGFYDYFTEEGNVLTIDSATVGSCFYQPLNFSASDHVEKLIPKFKMSKYIALFLTTIISLEKIRYGYGRKFAQMRIKQTTIKLPVDPQGNPDWEFMENYIKSLPYSFNL